LGNSVITSRDDSIVKIHTHTMKPGAVLDYCQDFGEFLTVKIENITLQHHGAKTPHKKYAIVTVASGKGVKKTFTELGCDVVIDGGQSRNPSVDDFVQAFGSLNADHILVFPNNPNIVMSAKQAADAFGNAQVHVVPSHNIGEGYAAISMLETNNESVKEIIKEAKEAMKEARKQKLMKTSVSYKEQLSIEERTCKAKLKSKREVEI
ncbi:MAG: hypothetical protein HUJ63_02460, partial [Enterococcus sp.]|nr:hypothetical protein [Enterococcus sp.]